MIGRLRAVTVSRYRNAGEAQAFAAPTLEDRLKALLVPPRHQAETGPRAGPFRDFACDRGIRASGFEILQEKDSQPRS